MRWRRGTRVKFKNYVCGSAKLSSSAGDVGTLAMVSFRPSVEPMPMDASDRTDTASDRQPYRSGDRSNGCCGRRCRGRAPDDGDGSALAAAGPHAPFRVGGRCGRPVPVSAPPPPPPSLLSLPLPKIDVGASAAVATLCPGGLSPPWSVNTETNRWTPKTVGVSRRRGRQNLLTWFTMANRFLFS